MNNLILTRSDEENQRLIDTAHELGFNPISLPMIKKHKINININQYSNFTNIIITSKFAAKIVASDLTFPAKIFVVGEESAKILESNKFCTIEAVYNNIQEAEKNINYESSIYFHGNNFTMKLPTKMVKIYEVEYFSGKLSSALAIDNILIFSEISAKHFILFIQQHNLLQEFKKSVLICISAKVAKIFGNMCDNIYFASKPNEKEMLELLKLYGRKIN